VRDAMLHALRTEALAGPILGDSGALIDYLSLDMAHLPTERLRVLFLNSGNRLLYDETLAEGSVSETPVYPREIMRRALEVGATALILVHNHPSGDPRPGRDDIEATRRIAEAGRALDICIHDHVIVARSGWSSFRALGLLQPAGPKK
jgi:DNA repair protein RadC